MGHKINYEVDLHELRRYRVHDSSGKIIERGETHLLRPANIQGEYVGTQDGEMVYQVKPIQEKQ